MAWGDMANVPACQVVVMPECFTKTIPADGLELTHSTSGARLFQHVTNQRSGRENETGE